MLSKAKTLRDYRLDGLDGDIGAVKEFYFDDQHWTVALAAVNREEQHIGIGLTKKQIEDSPSLNSGKPVSWQFIENRR